jgi:AhpD family alkylhydroperoxidase
MTRASPPGQDGAPSVPTGRIKTMHLSLKTFTGPALGTVALILASVSSASADEAADALAKTHMEIEQTFGGSPEFLKAFPAVALPGAWSETKALEFSDTALPVKTKALIALAVAAQIPCQYCVWSDTQQARRAGATEEEIYEAVAMSALERHWSTILNGTQADFTQFKKDMGGDAPINP